MLGVVLCCAVRQPRKCSCVLGVCAWCMAAAPVLVGASVAVKWQVLVSQFVTNERQCGTVVEHLCAPCCARVQLSHAHHATARPVRRPWRCGAVVLSVCVCVYAGCARCCALAQEVLVRAWCVR